MVNILAFKGITYNREKIKDFSLVITPPYDVISPEEEEKYNELSGYNFVRIILPEDNGDKYKRSGKMFNEWLKEGVFEQDKEDSIYIYSQRYKTDGKELIRIGFIALIELEELGAGVLPHEKTLSKPFEDRLRILEATHANLEQIFLIYDDKALTVDKILANAIKGRKEAIDFKDDSGTAHKLWKISDKEIIETIKKEMLRHKCIIADGHHRYKTYLRFRDTHPEIEKAKYAMMTFINSYHEGLIVLPINRLVHSLENADISRILNEIRKYFDVKELRNTQEMVKELGCTEILIDEKNHTKNHVFGMFCNINKKSYILRLKDAKILNGYFEDKSDIFKKLDINILHKIIFENMLGITEEEQKKGANIDYIKGAEKTLEKLKDKKYQFGFFLNPPLMKEISLIAKANELMPQKSTYFYPKVYSGLVINRIG